MICLGPPRATTGAHGLAASAASVVARRGVIIGLSASLPGMGGGPSGLPTDAPLSVKSILGLFAVTALLPLVSSSPPSIHLRMVAMSLASMGGELGGM